MISSEDQGEKSWLDLRWEGSGLDTRKNLPVVREVGPCFGVTVEFPLVVSFPQRTDYFGDNNRGAFFWAHRELDQKSCY